MNPYLYIEEDTFMHRMDPRVKLIFMLLSFFELSFITEQIWIACILLVLQVVLMILAKSISTLKRVRIVIVMLSLLNFISWVLFTRGPTKIWWFITFESVCQGISAAVRIISGVVVALLILSTTRNEEIVQGMIKLGMPYRGAFAFSSALRMVPTFLNSVFTVIAAQKSRGLDFENGRIGERLKKIFPMVVPSFLVALRSTDPFTMAIEAKGFSSKTKRTSYFKLKMKSSDWIFLIVSILIFAFCILCDVFDWFKVFNKI